MEQVIGVLLIFAVISQNTLSLTPNEMCELPEVEYFADPTSCRHFYQCSGVAHRKLCPGYLHFNKEASVCDWPDNVVCNLQPLVPPPSTAYTSTPTTTTTTTTTTITPTTTTTPPTTPYIPTQLCKRVVCFFSNQRLSPLGGPDQVNGSLCTHIIYKYAKITVDGKLAAGKVSDEVTVLDRVGDFKRILAHKQANRNLKVILSVGGPNVNSGFFMRVILNPKNRKTFIDSAVKFLRNRNLDGLDLSWEFPAFGGSFEEDKQKYSLLVKEFKNAFEIEAIKNSRTRLILSATVSARKRIIDDAYDVPVFNAFLDFINLKSYGFHSSFEPQTAHPSPLHVGNFESGSNLRRNVEWAANYWVSLGVRRDKLVIGVPLYGVEFRLKDEKNSNVGDATNCNSGDDNVFYYFKICIFLKSNTGNTKVNFINDQMVPYLITNNVQWIGYENRESLRLKINFIQQNNFGGVAIDDVRMDDMTGTVCGEGKLPLVTSIYQQCWS